MPELTEIAKAIDNQNKKIDKLTLVIIGDPELNIDGVIGTLKSQGKEIKRYGNDRTKMTLIGSVFGATFGGLVAAFWKTIFK